jgi:hypothetical protein
MCLNSTPCGPLKVAMARLTSSARRSWMEPSCQLHASAYFLPWKQSPVYQFTSLDGSELKSSAPARKPMSSYLGISSVESKNCIIIL